MRFTRPVFRAHNPEWAWSPASGEGARRFGGRFNRPGRPALYTSLTVRTAVLETSLLGRPMQPLTLCQYEVDAAPIFDATDPAARRAKSVNEQDLACPNWNRDMLDGRVPASQALAERLIAAGYVGMLVRSFARGATPDDLNIVSWSWGDGPPSLVRVIDEDGRLPRNRDSWR